jgi:GntP family gluconate:H+ symporter
MQTSFMHPPFGFALFYLRSVAPGEDYKDRLTGRTIAKVTTGQIYWGAVPFVVIQIVMVGLIIAFPGIVTRDLNKAAEGNIDQLQQDIDSSRKDAKPEPTLPALDSAAGSKTKDEPEDPMAAILRANEQDKQKK